MSWVFDTRWGNYHYQEKCWFLKKKKKCSYAILTMALDLLSAYFKTILYLVYITCLHNLESLNNHIQQIVERILAVADSGK